jgi:hypothetical protein
MNTGGAFFRIGYFTGSTHFCGSKKITEALFENIRIGHVYSFDAPLSREHYSEQIKLRMMMRTERSIRQTGVHQIKFYSGTI